MNWTQRIDWLLSRPLRKSQVDFLESVRRQIEKYPQLYPTLSQELVMARIYRHEKRLEKEALLGDCYC